MTREQVVQSPLTLLPDLHVLVQEGDGTGGSPEEVVHAHLTQDVALHVEERETFVVELVLPARVLHPRLRVQVVPVSGIWTERGTPFVTLSPVTNIQPPSPFSPSPGLCVPVTQVCGVWTKQSRTDLRLLSNHSLQPLCPIL